MAGILDKPDPELPKPDLHLCTTDELLKEIMKRHDAALVIVQIEAVPDEEWGWSFCWRGSLNTAIGMATRFQHEALHGFPTGIASPFADDNVDDEDEEEITP